MTGSGSTGSGTSGGRSSFSLPNSSRSSPSGTGTTGTQTGTSTQTSPLGATGQPDGSTGQPGRTTGQPTTGSGTDQTGQSQQTGQGQSGVSGQLPSQLREQPSALKTDPQNPEFQSSGGGKAQGSVPGGSLVALTEEERREIRDIILKQTAAQEARANFKVMVGAKVPQDVSLRPMPQEVVNVVPKYKDFDFTIVNDRIIVVQRSTREIDTMIPI